VKLMSVKSVIIAVLVLGRFGGLAPAEPAKAPGRVVVFVPVAEESGWGEMAYLAAVPAGMVATGGKPAVVALPGDGAIGPEIRDYLKRYKATRVHTVSSRSADAAACELSRAFWKSSATAVLCGRDDYASGLTASALAGRLGAPLLFCGDAGVSAGGARELARLGVARVIAVGKAKFSSSVVKVTRLADANAVLAWMGKNGHKVSYIAAVNPTDRTDTVIKKLSLAGPLLAAARGGAVVPLAYKSRWKVPFTGKTIKGDPPKGVTSRNRSKNKRDLPRAGTIKLDRRAYAFVATIKPHRLYVDFNADGAFDGKGEGPLKMGDAVTFGDKTYTLILGESSGPGKADVRLVWPMVGKVCEDLQASYKSAGGPPEYLCIVGYPDAFPQAVIPRDPGRHGDVPTDLPYANTDTDPFSEIATARLIGENASLATLHATRAITYEQLLDASWSGSVGQARWENSYWPLFENYGFKKQFHHDVDDLKWVVKPSEGVKGKRAKEFDQSSPLTNVAAITHMAHSFWKCLGQTYTWDSSALLAPTLVESGGCLTAALGRDAGFRSVIARMFRNGAVGFVGNASPGIAAQEHMRMSFWNGVLSGETIGQAHRRSQNSMCLEVLDRGQIERGGGQHYTWSIRTLFGDPAFRMKVPGRAKTAPAHVAVDGNAVAVHGPGAWWPVSIRVPEDWKKWADKKLYVMRGAGVYVSRNWCGGGYDIERHCINAEIRTSRKIKSIKQVQNPPTPLGWNEKYWTDEHADGSRTYRWRVRLLDFDQTTGKITNRTNRLDYRIEWE
jgi:hypothetical protein